MAHKYNAKLSYGGKSISVLLTKIQWGWGQQVNRVQTRQHTVVYGGSRVQESLSITGQCYSEHEKTELAKFIRDWHKYATSRARPAFVRLTYPTRSIDYLIIPRMIDTGAKVGVFAPTWNINCELVRDMLDKGTGPLSHATNKWWWEKGYQGHLEDISNDEVLAPVDIDIMDGTEPEDAFRGNSPTIDLSMDNLNLVESHH